MKFWRPGITAKLFLAILTTCIMLLIIMHWAVRISFERGFIDYIKRGNEQRLQLLSDTLAEQYAQHGDWQFLRNNDRMIFQILRSFERDNDHEDDHPGGPDRDMEGDRGMGPDNRADPNHRMGQDEDANRGMGPADNAERDRGMGPGGENDRMDNRQGAEEDNGPDLSGPPGPPPPRGWRTVFWVIDQNNNVLVGPRNRVPEEGNRRAIVVNQKTVGWVIASPVERLTRNTDINFDRQQRRTSWLIVALATLLAALATFPLARGLLAPVKRLVEGTHKLASGDFTTRVKPGSQDELGRLARDFNLLASTLEKNQQMRRDFMADISHELRTPLAVLRGELEAIQDGVRKFTPESVLSLQAEVGTLTKLVDDLHQLSMSDEGALAYQRTPVDVVTLLEIAAGAFRERFASRNLNLLLDLQSTSGRVFGDADRLMQLFNNLLENSLRYTDGGGQTQIQTTTREGKLILRFADSAPGVADEQLPRLFERFYRTEGSRNRASGGSGLGLAICLNIVEAHGGAIHAGHSPFGGVSITVELPLEREKSREV